LQYYVYNFLVGAIGDPITDVSSLSSNVPLPEGNDTAGNNQSNISLLLQEV